jgi:hypothetical protein
MENLTMLIDFTPVREGSLKLLEFAQRFTFHDLRLAVNAYIDATLDLLADCDDAMLTFEPHDPEAHDPFAPEADQHIGWNLAHLVLHVTASLEEGAAFCSILGRGVPVVVALGETYRPLSPSLCRCCRCRHRPFRARQQSPHPSPEECGSIPQSPLD